jgi:hypothetical protein
MEGHLSSNRVAVFSESLINKMSDFNFNFNVYVYVFLYLAVIVIVAHRLLCIEHDFEVAGEIGHRGRR